MLAHRLRRWSNIKPTLVQRLVFAGIAVVIARGLWRFNDASHVKVGGSS